VVLKSGPSDEKRGASAVSLSFERRQSLERAGFDAAKDLDAALTELGQITAPNERAAFLRGLFESLSTGDRKVAMGALKKLKEADRATAAMALVDSWQPEARTRFQRDGRMEGMLGFALLDKDPMLAADWAKTVLEGDGSKQLLNRAVENIAKQNPQEALAMAKDLTGDERRDFLARIARGWAQTNPDDALSWAGKEADAEVRATLTANALTGMADKNPAAAASNLDKLAPGDDRNRVIDRIVRGYVNSDIASSEKFVASLKDPNEQKSAQRALDEAAPVGLGAQIRPTREGGLRVQGVIEGSSGAQAGLKANDRIVAVTDANGQMVDLTKLDMRQSYQLLGGQAGATKTVQVVDESNANPRTVTTTLDRYVNPNQGGPGGFGGGPGGGGPGGFGGGGGGAAGGGGRRGR
jgi:hypothetical protein